MKMPKNVVCLELDFNEEIEPEHRSNINIISQNLDDFNKRFETDFILYYDVYGYAFEMPEELENHQLLVWFLEGIPELLAFAYSPTMTSYEDLDEYLGQRKRELNYVFNIEMFKNFQRRYIDYAPLGFLEEPDYLYIKDKLTDLILDKTNGLYEK